jgi:hypothetical protein
VAGFQAAITPPSGMIDRLPVPCRIIPFLANSPMNIMMQSCFMLWCRNGVETFDKVIPPLRALAKGNARSTNFALEDSVPELNRQKLVELAGSCFAIGIEEATDDAAYNIKAVNDQDADQILLFREIAAIF